MQLEQIGSRYKILEKIGQGAMGEVYKVHDAVLNRLVAVKTISASLAGDETLRKRFEREAQSAARLNHPNIITVYELGHEHEKIYMAMELLEGYDLKHAIAHNTLPTLDQKIDVMAQICDGLSFAHASEIVHRDLKPANIHVQPNGQIKIMDFGLARLGGSEMTRTGMVMGTPHYMSPEQVRGERADTRSDIFALGCVFYELLSGHKPFDADSMHAVLFKVMQEDPAPLSDVAREVPYVLMELTERALDKDPAARFQNAGELRAAVHVAQQAILEGRGEEPLPPLVASTRQPGAATLVPAVPGAAGTEPRRGPGSSVRADRSALRSSPGSRVRSRPPAPAPAPHPPAPRSKLPWILAAVGLLIVLGAAMAVVAFREPGPQVSATAATVPADSDAVRLSRTLARTRVELARKRMEAGDYREAAQRAEQALELDPANKDAQEIQARARKVLEGIEDAAQATRRAAAAGDGPRTADALWSLMLLDPTNALVGELASAQSARLESRLPEARRMVAAARAGAEKAQAGNLDSFREGVAAATAGEAAARSGQSVAALRKLVEARSLFERAAASAAARQ